jgi:hypothetical protein
LAGLSLRLYNPGGVRMTRIAQKRRLPASVFARLSETFWVFSRFDTLGLFWLFPAVVK